MYTLNNNISLLKIKHNTKERSSVKKTMSSCVINRFHGAVVLFYIDSEYFNDVRDAFKRIKNVN